MPGFATSKRTLDQARRLMAAVRLQRRRDRHPAELPADAGRHRPSVRARRGRSTTSPSRTCRPASAPATCSGSPTCTAALVVGTGDLSELALGWSTYGVGDHMSHYNVNASVPKTLIKHLVRWVAGKRLARARATSRCSTRSLATEISPELVPGRRQRRRRRRAREDARRPVRAAGLPPLPGAALRLRAEQGRVPRLDRLARPAGRWPDGPTCRTTPTRWPRSSSTCATSC